MSLREAIESIKSLRTYPVVTVDSKRLAAAGDYTAEDVMSELASGGTTYMFSNMARRSSGSGVIEKAIVYCSVTNLTPRITLFLYHTLPTSVLNDNVANTGPSLADHWACEGWIDFPALEDLGGISAAIVTPSTLGNLPLVYKCADRRLFGIAVTRDAITSEAVAMSLNFKMQIRQD